MFNWLISLFKQKETQSEGIFKKEQQYFIELNSGKQFIGFFDGVLEDFIVFKKSNKKFFIPYSNIEYIEENQIKKGN